MIRFGIAFLLLFLGATRGSAQCPDGSSPPCGSALQAPPLQDATWMVIPFDLATQDSALRWTQPASAHLLTLELSRQDDRVVVDDARVRAWLMNTTPRDTSGVALETALAVARRGGAGHLVMGRLDVVRDTITISATLIATATGARVRSISRIATRPAALPDAFAALAVQLTGSEGAEEATSGLGTVSVPAYRHFLDGRDAMMRARFDSAAAAFARATTADSMFALAHAGQATTTLRHHDGDPPLARSYALSAARFGQGLPARERSLIMVSLALAESRYPEACRGADAMIARDSSDAEAWYLRGECHFHDRAVIRESGVARFRSSWHQALRSFERATALTPTLTVAYPHIPEMLSTFARRGCSVDELAAVCPERWAGVVRLVGDSLRTLAFDVSRGEVEPQPPTPAEMREMSVALAVRELDAASVWFAAAPEDPAARLLFVEALLRNGTGSRAAQEAALLPGATDATPASVRRLEAVVDAAIHGGDVTAASQRLDDAMQFTDDTPATADLRTIIATRRALLGQFEAIMALPQLPSPSRAYAIEAMRVAAGLPGDSLERLAAGHREFVLRETPRNNAPLLEGILGGAGEAIAVGTRWPFARANGNPTPINQLARARVANNTEAARRHLAALDEIVTLDARPDINGVLFQLSGEAHLALGDSTLALERFRGFLARLPRTATTVVLENEEPIYTALLWGRGALTAGDLAMALGDRALARAAYQLVASLWAAADGPLQPAVTRARAALENLQAP